MPKKKDVFVVGGSWPVKRLGERLIRLKEVLESDDKMPGNATPGFSMTACMSKMKGKADNPAAMCQYMFQRWKSGQIKNPFPESYKEKLARMKESLKEVWWVEDTYEDKSAAEHQADKLQGQGMKTKIEPQKVRGKDVYVLHVDHGPKE